MPAATGRVRLIVLNHNGGPLTVRCFEHLHALDWPTDQLELVLIDNASSDGSADDVAAKFPGVRVVRNERNTGFPANNLGLADLDGVRYVGLVNNDGFVEPGWLRELAGALDADPALGAVAPKMVFAPRFVGATIEASASPPAPGDTRELGVMVTGIRVAGADAWSSAQLGEGAWGVEHGRSGPFRWTAGRAELRVPLPDDAASIAATDGLPTVAVELEVRADEPKRMTIRSGRHTVSADVGPERRWVHFVAEGEPFDVVQNAGSMVYGDGAGADRGFLEPDDGRFDDPVDVFAWCGGSVLFRPDYVRATGCFDERFFLYYEDTDWAWRGRARGWRYRYVPTAVMRHVHAATSGEGSPVFAYHVERNRLLMLVKNAPARMALVQVVRFVLITASYARRDVAGPLRSRRRPDLTVVRRRVGSFLGFLRLLPAMLVSRRDLRRNRTVADAELASWLVPHRP